MDYNLQIQKLLVKADAVALPQDKLNFIKQAISVADSHNDIEWGFDLRLELIDIESDMARRAESLPAFTWILDTYDNNSDLFRERDFLWKYKWMISYVRRTVSVSVEQNESIMEDFKTRLQRNGYSLRPYYQAKAHMANFVDNQEEVRKYLNLADKELRDNMSNCAACELDDKVELELRLGNFDTAMTMGSDLFSKKLTCAHMPFATYCTCVECFTDAKEYERAHDFFLKAEEDLRAMENDTSQISNVAKMIHFLSVYGQKDKAWEYFEQYAEWSHESDDYRCYTFAVNVLHLLKTGGELTLKVSPIMPWYKADNVYSALQLYNYYYAMATDLGAQFDNRHNTSFFTKKINDVLNA